MIFRQNYKDVKDYLNYHQKILQNKESTIDSYESAFKRILTWCDDIPFPEFSRARITLPTFLKNDVMSGVISERTAADTCSLFREFLRYMVAENHARYGKVKKSQIDENKYIVHSDSAQMPKYVTLDEMRKIASVQPETLFQRRAIAGASFLYLSGMRVGAFATIPIECIDIEKRKVYQFPEMGVHTKFTKRAITTLLPIQFLLDIVADWDALVRSKCPSNSTWYARLSSDEIMMYRNPHPIGATCFDPLIPEKKDWDESRRIATRRHNAISEGLKVICAMAGIEYKNPHAFRHGHVHFGLSNAQSMEQIKAVSQNVMHNNTAITDEIYSKLNHEKLNDVISKMTIKEETPTIPTANGLTANDILSGMSVDEKKQLLKELLGL